MALTGRQKMLLHLAVQHYDNNVNAAYLDPLSLEQQLQSDSTELAEDIDVLEEQGYLKRAAPDAADEEESWVLTPTEKGVMTTMGMS